MSIGLFLPGAHSARNFANLQWPGRGRPEQRSAPGAEPGVRLAILGRRAPAVRPAAYHTAPPTVLTHTIPDAQLDGIEFGNNPVMVERQKWAINMAKDRSLLPADALGVGIYSSHPNDNNGFTWQGNAALIAQDDALRAAVA